jgi:hypothetical protein
LRESDNGLGVSTCNIACSLSSPIYLSVGTMHTGENALAFKLWIEMTDTSKRFEVLVLVNLGASGDFVDGLFLEKNGIDTIGLYRPIPVRNTDGTKNQGSPIKAYVLCFLDAPERREKVRLEVTHLGSIRASSSFFSLLKVFGRKVF